MADGSTSKVHLPSGDPEMKGWLFKWTNYLKGYQRRWFVLSNGLLSYYRNQAEMAHTCRGTISLLGALIHTVDSCTFVISNGGTQTFHIKAASEVERQNWVTALELAKAKAIRATESDDDDVNAVGDGGVRLTGNASGGTNKNIDDGAPRELAVRLDDLRTCAELVARHGAALQRALAELDLPQSEQMRQSSERATLFRIACNAMMNASADFLQVAQNAGVRWSRMLQHEREQKTRLQEVVEQLARQHDTLEKSVTARATSQPSDSTHDTDDEEHEFFDAQDGGSFSAISTGEENSFIIKIPIKGNRKNSAYNESSEESEPEDVTETQQVLFVQEESNGRASLEVNTSTSTMSPTITDADQMTEVTDSAAGIMSRQVSSLKDSNQLKQKEYKIWPHPTQLVQTPGVKNRRTRVADKPNYTLNLWSILKNCIGKELTKIPIPVNFSEPLSMLQRLTEDYEYSNILDRAARCTDPCEQLAYVTAFTVSSYATTAYRTAKPFNPMLGETFECDRWSDLGWRSISEQVSHHPPMLAQYCEGASGWRCWQEFTFTSKFRGKYIQVIPLGNATAEFVDSGNKYSWRKVTTTVHNVIVGKLWVDQHGDMDIIGEGGNASGVKAHIKYLPYSYFSKDAQRKVTGVVKNAFGQPKWVIQGYWDKRVEIAPVTGTNADSSVCKTGRFTTIWEKIDPAPDSERFYNFTILAAQLNEPEDGICITDSRLRPDQRLMEEGLWDEANQEKLRLEEEQRTRRRAFEASSQNSVERGLPPPKGHTPIWFTRRPISSSPDAPLRHIFNGDYWDCKQAQDWSSCPKIF